MAEYRLLIKASAAKELEAVNTKADRRRIVQRMQALAADPGPKGPKSSLGTPIVTGCDKEVAIFM